MGRGRGAGVGKGWRLVWETVRGERARREGEDSQWVTGGGGNEEQMVHARARDGEGRKSGSAKDDTFGVAGIEGAGKDGSVRGIPG